MIIPIKAILNLSYTPCDIPNLMIPNQCDKSGFRLSGLWSLAWLERLVVAMERLAIAGERELRGGFGGLFASGGETVCCGRDGDALVGAGDIVEGDQGEEEDEQ